MTHVVVLGAGIAGIPVAYALKSRLGRNDEVTVVSDRDYFHFVPSNPWIAMGWRNARQYRHHSVHSMPLWSMASKTDQIAAVQSFDTVETLEDHLRDGGFGSWLMEAVAGQPGVATRLRAHALSPAVCETVGSQNMLIALGGLNEQSAPGPMART